MAWLMIVNLIGEVFSVHSIHRKLVALLSKDLLTSSPLLTEGTPRNGHILSHPR